MRRAAWSAVPAWTDGPPIGDLVLPFLALVRARFLQGHLSLALHLALADDEEWTTLDFETLELTSGPQGFPRARSGLDVAFTLVAMSDKFGPAPAGYAMPSCPNAIPIEGPLPADGSIPDALLAARDAAVDEAVAALAAVVPNDGVPPRADHSGVLWIFDPAHWWGAGDVAAGLAATALGFLRDEPADFIRGQVYDDRRKHRNALLESARPPTLGWLLELVDLPQSGAFWWGVGQALQARGEAHRLTMGDRARLSSQHHGPSWLETLVELLQTGVLDLDGLFDGADPIEPIVEHAVDDRTIELTVWGEETVALQRVMNLPETDVIAGSYAWDYVYGTAEQPPRVVVIAGRGIEIRDRWKKDFPWELELVRVQDNSPIPAPGELVDLTPILAPGLISPDVAEAPSCKGVKTGAYPLAAVWPKPDGLYLEYPVWSNELDPTAPEDPEGVSSEAIPFSLEITVDPRSGTQGYIYDVHYYRYQWGENYQLGGAHIPVWVASGVDIDCSGSPMDGLLASTSQAASTTFYQSCWTASAEFWEADSVAPLGKPLATHLQITPALAWHDDLVVGDIPRFGDEFPTHFLDELNVMLSKKTYRHKTFRYRDSMVFDLLDLMIGFIPLVGDAVDIAEVGLAWTTGKDKWGRPVSNFQLSLMTIGAAVPFVSGSLVADVGEVVAARGDGLLHLHAPGAFSVIFDGVSAELTTEGDEVASLLTLPRAWDDSGWRIGTSRRSSLTGEVLGELVNDADEIGAYGARLATDAGDEWIALPDLLDVTGNGFRPNPMQVDFLRWSTRSSDVSTTAFLTPDLVGRARQVALPVLGSNTIEDVARMERRIARAAPDPSAVGRPRVAGIATPLSMVSGPSIAGHVRSYLDIALGPASRSRIWSNQALRPVAAVIDRDPAFFGDGFVKLLRELSPTRSLGDIPEASMASVVGRDFVGGVQLSEGERGARAAHALFDAFDELVTSGVDPDVLFNDALLPALRAFVRSRVVNYGRAVGSRFEFRFAADIEATLSKIARRHQLDMPDLRRAALVSGPDSVLYVDGVAYLVQLKAYANFSNLLDGTLMWSFDDATGRVLRVWGPTLLAQPMRDLTRARIWNHMVPGPGVVAEGASLPADLTGWFPLARVHAMVIDDIYMSRSMCDLLAGGLRRGGRVDIANAVDAPQFLLTQLIDVYGPNPVVRDSNRLFETGMDWIRANAGDAERTLNSTLRESEVWKAIGDIFEYRVILASDKAESILPRLLETP